MSMEARIDALRRKHAHLDEELEYEIHRPFPNGAAIWRLKREKLFLKDEISRLDAANDDVPQTQGGVA